MVSEEGSSPIFNVVDEHLVMDSLFIGTITATSEILSWDESNYFQHSIFNTISRVRPSWTDTLWCTVLQDTNNACQRHTPDEIPTYCAQFSKWSKSHAIDYRGGDFFATVYGCSVSKFVDSLRLGGDGGPLPPNDLFHAMRKSLKSPWRFAVTSSGHPVLVDVETKAGNHIVVIPTVKSPIIVRGTQGREDGEEIVGERIGIAGYFHGIMDGEAWTSEDKYSLRTVRFV
jgi:hypothetical protein